jgi:hypothetical protein
VTECHVTDGDSEPSAPPWAAEWAAHFVAVVASFLLLWLITVICAATISFDIDRLPRLLSQITFPKETVAPEPAERTAYFASLILIPSFMLLMHPALRRRASRMSTAGQWAYFIASGVAMLILIALGGLGDGAFYWRGSLLYSNPAGFCMATIAVSLLLERRATEHIPAAYLRRISFARDCGLVVAVFMFIVVTSTLRIFPASDPYVTDNHFEAVFFTSTQVALGSTLLVDLPHQYGLYPEFLAPIFRLLGGITVIRFTAVMAILQIVAYILWLGALLRVMRTPWMAMLTFLGAFSLASFLVPLFVVQQGFIPYYDPYFQYFPVRILFPAIALYSMAWITEHDRFEKRRLRYVLSAILGLGILWNADAGIPALGAWILCLCHQAIVRSDITSRSLVVAVRTALPVLAEALFCACVAVFLGLTALAWKAGAWPDPNMNLRFQMIFYGIGFYMLPMRVMHSWAAWAAVVMATLSFGIWPLSSTQREQRQLLLRSTLFGWAVMACGLFSYYQGRSHDWVFPVVIPFALSFVGIAIDRLFMPLATDPVSGQKWRLAGCVLAAAFVIAMGSGILSAWSPDQLLRKQVQSRWLALTSDERSAPEPEAVAFAKQRLKAGETALILSNHAGIYHAESQTRSPLPMSLIELILRTDRDDVLRQIAESERLFIDRSVLAVQTPNTNPETNFLISQEVAKRFRKVAESRDGYLLEVERRPVEEISDDAPGR